MRTDYFEYSNGQVRQQLFEIVLKSLDHYVVFQPSLTVTSLDAGYNISIFTFKTWYNSSEHTSIPGISTFVSATKRDWEDPVYRKDRVRM